MTDLFGTALTLSPSVVTPQNPQNPVADGCETRLPAYAQKPQKVGSAELPAVQSATFPRGRPFQPGQTGNPAGRPKGSKNRLTDAFLAALIYDFGEYGAAAIARVRDADPVAYLKMVTSIIPRELIVDREREPDYTDLESDEVADIVSKARKQALMRQALEAVREPNLR